MLRYILQPYFDVEIDSKQILCAESAELILFSLKASFLTNLIIFVVRFQMAAFLAPQRERPLIGQK